MFQTLKSNQFLFEELVKRDFKKKYKRTVLGMAWSVLSPLLSLLVMRLVFTQLLMYASAIFYSVDNYGPKVQRVFLANPVYLIIKYFRVIVIDASVQHRL